VVALRGYVPAQWKTRFRVWPEDDRRAAELRKRRPHQGGEQVVHEIIPDHRFSRTLLARKASRVLRFRAIRQISNRGLCAVQTTKPKT
jgi:hypothetical protein